MAHDHDHSWLERTFGPSFETSLPGYILGGGGTVLMLIGLYWESKEVMGLGVSAVGTAIFLVARYARSQGQHERDIPAVTHAITSDVIPEAREVARRTAREEVTERDRRDQR